ncbi:hypothetical protein ACHAWU_009407 [Discostella pseudostelligera]|uniref:Major facilitator superfamily (MFS) profile domain-containing protein n=1 Tax=Discostella pseudostelligera TaxID=259834 RepID=A0ABD3MM93_9STRA
MGRHELYAELPFVAVLGLQKKERSLSVAFSNAAALIENQESDIVSMLSTSENGTDRDEKEERVRRMSVILMDEIEGTDELYLTVPLVVAVMIASMFTFNVGYNVGVMNTSEAYVFPGHSMEIWSLAVSVWCIGGLVGAGLAGKWADTYGRKKALLLTAWPYVVGGWIQTCSLSMSMIVVARAIIGVACGATTVLVPIYLGELAPPNLRGYIGTMTQFTMVFGILFSDIISFFFANKDQWRLMVFLTAFCGMVPLLLESFLYESPRWLLSRDQDSEEARCILQKLRGFRYEDEVETEVDHFLGALKSQSLGSGGGGKPGDRKGATAELFADRSVRLQLVSSLLLQVSKMMSGYVYICWWLNASDAFNLSLINDLLSLYRS